MSKPEVQAFFDEATFTVSYVVSDPASGRAAIIDSVLDFDPASGRTSTVSADGLIAYVKENELAIDWILETHVHADHISGAAFLQEQLGGQTAIGRGVTAVQSTFKSVFNLPDLAVDGRQFDLLFDDGDTFDIGSLSASVTATPGHTPACVTYVIGNTAYVGDTLFMPDFGTARTDFPGGSAAQLYRSIQKIFALPGDTRLFMCHDYKAPGRDEFAWETTVAAQRDGNIHVNKSVSEEAFVETRENRDRQLGMPKLLLPAIQVNIRAGRLPDPENNGIRYVKIPINAV
ncbi:MAG: MBL fold metallo-hydrolase [Gammaproteobacteria bacterium]|nr:MBL fold metallo-hydrolase [Gammaproteobacteria bacterium]MDH3362521.1 MBL fold metallo-hydrolase [Gammaproteobacteria bacterium]MDH3480070.1 MBL fold metallo-hydrolase [Gammaproteobacteria bacterium]